MIGEHTYNNDNSQDEDWESRERELVEEWLDHGRLYPLLPVLSSINHNAKICKDQSLRGEGCTRFKCLENSCDGS
jgi:hypothetical protein